MDKGVSMNRVIAALCVILGVVLYVGRAEGQTNSRNWGNIVQTMVGGQSSTTSTAVSNFNALWPFKYFSLGVTPIGSPSYSVVLEGSNDRLNWSPLVYNSNVTNSGGSVAFQSNAKPVLYMRVRAESLTAAATITATAVGVP